MGTGYGAVYKGVAGDGMLGHSLLSDEDDLLPLSGDRDGLLPLPTDASPSRSANALREDTRSIGNSFTVQEPEEETPDDDDGLTITTTSGVDVSSLFRVEKRVHVGSKPRSRRESSPDKDGYRFPYGRIVVEPVADETLNTFTPGTFQVRLYWQRGKNRIALMESTPLRPIAQVTLSGQKYPVFFNQHSRKKRDRIVFGGKRKTAKSARCLLRFVTFIEGREDRLNWFWRIGATSAAIAHNESARSADTDIPLEDEINLSLPFASGKNQIITQPDAPNVLALWHNDMVMTVAAGQATGVHENYSATPLLTYDSRGFTLSLRGADFGGGVSLQWETWFTSARTEAEVRAALLLHAADIADRIQMVIPTQEGENSLLRIIEDNEKALMAEDIVSKRGIDRSAYHPKPGDKTFICGAGGDTALTCVALLARYYMTGDDAMRRRARLVSRGVCDFQITTEDSPHWGAIYDANVKKKFVDHEGGNTVSVTTTARAAKGLHIAHAHFEVEILQRTALAATQWLLLKMGMDGFMTAERFQEDGLPVPETFSKWLSGEILLPFAETFRVTQNEVFIKVALRSIAAIRNALDEGTLRFEQATAEQLASTIEGVLLVSREYESEEMIALAKRLMAGLRVRRLPDGSFGESPLVTTYSPLTSTLAGCRAALALTRVDNDPNLTLTALRALRAADRIARERIERGEHVAIADKTSLLMHSIGVFLSIAQRVSALEADRERASVKRGWQTFAPDPATREFVQVTLLDGRPVDHLSLVDQVSLQVLIIVIAPPEVEEVVIVKNGRTPFLRGLLDNSYDIRAHLVPLGDGKEAKVGVFLADT